MAKAVIATIGEDRPGLVNELSQLILDTGLNIEDSRMSVLGGEFAVLMSVTGSEDALAKLQQALREYTDTSGLAHLFRRTADGPTSSGGFFSVTVETFDHPGIVQSIASFFSARGINIRDLETETRPAAHTGAPVFSVGMTIELPPDQSLAPLQEAFHTFCEQQDLDGAIGGEADV